MAAGVSGVGAVFGAVMFALMVRFEFTKLPRLLFWIGFVDALVAIVTVLVTWLVLTTYEAKLSTVHSAKGLEWSTVHLLHAVDGAFLLTWRWPTTMVWRRSSGCSTSLSPALVTPSGSTHRRGCRPTRSAPVARVEIPTLEDLLA